MVNTYTPNDNQRPALHSGVDTRISYIDRWRLVLYE